MVRVFCVVRPVGTVRFRVEPDLESTQEFWPVANTREQLFVANMTGLIASEEYYAETPLSGIPAMVMPHVKTLAIK
jgi:hypothetical protein